METNPVLKNITDYLIEEVSAEEEELTGASAGGSGEEGKDPASSDVLVEKDEKLVKVGGVCCVGRAEMWVAHRGGRGCDESVAGRRAVL